MGDVFVKKATVLILTVVMLFICVPFYVFAADGVEIIPSVSQPVLGDTVTFTVTFNTSSDMTAFSYTLNYDQNVLELSSASAAEYNLVEEGRLLYLAVTQEVKTVTETYTFKCIGSGDTSVTVTDIYSADNDEYKYEDACYGFNVAVKRLGDVNGDGNVDAVDLGNMKLYLSGAPIEINYLNSDFDNDEIISTADLSRLKLILAGS